MLGIFGEDRLPRREYVPKVTKLQITGLVIIILASFAWVFLGVLGGILIPTPYAVLRLAYYVAPVFTLGGLIIYLVGARAARRG